ncbi:MAG: hypothetical protein B6I30_09745 [Desulfobacteraceae bacterium 4572_187]|nr:MAG: hypothetical protein B6I30_09745 [Desulfobacteraceae bacterium 4572_187]
MRNYKRKSINLKKKMLNSSNSSSRKRFRPPINKLISLHQSRQNGRRAAPKGKIRAKRNAKSESPAKERAIVPKIKNLTEQRRLWLKNVIYVEKI